MAKNGLRIEVEGLDEFMKKMKVHAGTKFETEVGDWVEASGMEFLENVQNMIRTMGVVDTRRLLNSFDKGSGDGIWKKSFNGLQLQIGTNVEYARWVNDGHWSDGRKRPSRFVPGYWSGDKFTYSPGANMGMVLKLQYIEARPYFDNAVKVFEAIFAKSFEKNLSKWAKKF